MYAHIFARLWLLQCNVSELGCNRVVFLYDNMSAAHAVSGVCPARGSPVLCKLGMAIHRICCNNFSISDHHIHSHREHPWNELADSICSHVVDKTQDAKNSITPISPVSEYDVFCLDVASVMGSEYMSDSLVKEEGIRCDIQLALEADMLASRIDNHGDHDLALSAKAQPVFCIQYNVQTLKDAGDETDMFAKFRIEKAAIICLQENRKTYSGIKDMYGYFRCIAAASQGDYGVEVAISKSVSFAIEGSGSKVRIAREDISIIDGNPRFILVRVCNKFLDFYIVSAHAPYMKSSTPYAQWWSNFKQAVVKLCKPGKPVVIGIDANSQLYKCDMYEDVEVSLKGGKPPANFTAMCKCFDELRCKLPCMWLHNYVSDFSAEFGTFHPTIGNEIIMLDYIACINNIECVPGSLCMVPAVTRGPIGKDHIPIGARLIISSPDELGKVCNDKRRKIDYDLAKVKDEVCAAAFAAKMRDFPVVSVEVENSTHCYLVQNYMHDALVECFPKSSETRKSKDYITEYTYESIKEGHRLCKSMFKASRYLRNASLFAFFKAWQYQRSPRMHAVFGYAKANSVKKYLCMRNESKTHRIQLNGLLKLERNMYVSDKADRLEKAFSKGNMHDMYKELGSLTKFAKASGNATVQVGRVHDDNGNPAQSFAEEKKFFRNHFSKTMSASCVSYASVICKDRDNNNDESKDRFKHINHSTLWKEVPTPSDIVVMNANSKKNKAPGEDLCSGNVLATFALELMHVYYPLVLKTFMRVQPPIQWKGGMLQELFKGKGSPHSRANFRDVMLASVDGKNVAKYVRNNLLPRAKHISLSTQFGGVLMGEKLLLPIYMYESSTKLASF